MADNENKEKEDNLVTYITEDLIKRTTKSENLRDVVSLNLHLRTKHKIKVSKFHFKITISILMNNSYIVHRTLG